MRIEITADVVGPQGKHYFAGREGQQPTVIDVPDEAAQAMIQSGRAKEAAKTAKLFENEPAQPEPPAKTKAGRIDKREPVVENRDPS